MALCSFLSFGNAGIQSFCCGALHSVRCPWYLAGTAKHWQVIVSTGPSNKDCICRRLSARSESSTPHLNCGKPSKHHCQGCSWKGVPKARVLSEKLLNQPDMPRSLYVCSSTCHRMLFGSEGLIQFSAMSSTFAPGTVTRGVTCCSYQLFVWWKVGGRIFVCNLLSRILCR